MFKLTMPAALVSAALIGAGGLVGCEVRAYGPPPPAAEVTVGGPAIEGGIAIGDVPPPDQREYVYDPGYPPGVYVYDGYYYYNGYRYPHDVFIHRYVEPNIRAHRYVDRNANRRDGEVIRSRDRADFAHSGGHPARPADHRDDHH